MSMTREDSVLALSNAEILTACTTDLELSQESNLVSWALSGEYDENVPVLIDAEDASRYLTKHKATALIEALAGAFRSRTTVCVHAPNNILYPVLVLAILASGCTWTGTNPAYTSNELEHHFRMSKTSYVITRPEYLDTVLAAVSACKDSFDAIEIVLESDIAVEGGVNPEGTNLNGSNFRTLHDLLNSSNAPTLQSRLATISGDTSAAVFSTSGTTGLPKMVQRTHRELILESKATEDNNSLKPYKIRRLYCTPMFHAFSFIDMVINTFRLGFPSFYMRRYDDTFSQKAFVFSITETLVVPPILMRLVDQARTKNETGPQLQSLQAVICAGAPLSSELRTSFTRLLCDSARLIQGWGMSEGGWFTAFRYPECDDTGSVGRPVAGYEVRPGDEHLIEIGQGRFASELLVRAPQLPRSYMDNPGATAEAFTEDGWLRTGDIGYEEDGKIYLLDRAKDMIKVNGWSVVPTELEAALSLNPRVCDAAVVGYGSGTDEHPLVFVVPRDPDVSVAEIIDHLMKSVARFKVSNCEVKFVDSIPRNPSGKILRKLLRQQ